MVPYFSFLWNFWKRVTKPLGKKRDAALCLESETAALRLGMRRRATVLLFCVFFFFFFFVLLFVLLFEKKRDALPRDAGEV